ncbi:MAG: hypothetical protein FWB94_12100 [Chitinispirillia bacterium]|nr:hypothetical protein [Chitinispirillia bacterium]
MKRRFSCLAAIAAAAALTVMPQANATEVMSIDSQEVVVTTTVPSLNGKFTIIPNPVIRPSTGINIYWDGENVTDTTLHIYNTSGGLVAGVDIKDAGAGDIRRRRIGVWNLRNTHGRQLSAGRYLLRGTLTTAGGESMLVRLTVDLR